MYSSWLYGNESVRLIQHHHAGGDEPLFMYIAWNNVHDPCQAPAMYTAPLAGRTSRPNFVGMMQALDDSMLAVVDTIKSLGMWSNSVWVFTTDNGGNLGGGGNNWPLRGGKFTFWEGGVRGRCFITSPLLPQSLVNTTWHGLAHAADMYSTIALLGGVPLRTLMNESGPLPPDGVDMWGTLMSGGGVSKRTEVVINIQNAPTSPPDGNDIALEAVYTPLHDDPMFDGRVPDQQQLQLQQVGWLQQAKPNEPRPFPELLACDDGTNLTLAALQSWQAPPTSVTQLADICSQAPAGANNTDPGFAQSPCWNIQRSASKLILWPHQDQSNARFGLVSTRLVSGLGDAEEAGEVCVGAPGLDEQLELYHNCSEIARQQGGPLVDGWGWNSSTGQLHHGEMCITANHHGEHGGGSGKGKFFGVLRSGQWKLIIGYPGNGKAGWDGWVPLKGPDDEHNNNHIGAEVKGVAVGQFCVASPCLFDIENDPQERHDLAAETPLVVQQLTARLMELGKSEVTVAASGLCPTQYGSHNDPRCGAKARETGFWEPWL